MGNAGSHCKIQNYEQSSNQRFVIIKSQTIDNNGGNRHEDVNACMMPFLYVKLKVDTHFQSTKKIDTTTKIKLLWETDSRKISYDVIHKKYLFQI
jgi:hypothetical protein